MNFFASTRNRIAIAAIALLGVAAINPRVNYSASTGLVLASCSTNHMYFQRMSYNGVELPGGIYTPESLADRLWDVGVNEYMASVEGNPFAGVGLLMAESLREPLQKMTRRAAQDACAGRTNSMLSGLSALSR